MAIQVHRQEYGHGSSIGSKQQCHQHRNVEAHELLACPFHQHQSEAHEDPSSLQACSGVPALPMKKPKYGCDQDPSLYESFDWFEAQRGTDVKVTGQQFRPRQPPALPLLPGPEFEIRQVQPIEAQQLHQTGAPQRLLRSSCKRNRQFLRHLRALGRRRCTP